MNVHDAVVQVLHDMGRPLHLKEIAERIISNGLWVAKGKTPEATVAANLYTDIKKKGDKSAFILIAPQKFALRENMTTYSLSSDIKDGTEKYSFTDSAERILEKYGERRPMHYRSITKKALELGWLSTEGKTPEATMYAQILTEIKRYQRRGEQPRFVQHGKGIVGLSRWMGRGLAFDIEEHNRKVRQSLLKQLLIMKWNEFEELIARLLAEMGFDEIEVTNRGKDGGIDVRGTLVVGDVIRTRMAIQVKKWKHNVQSPIVQQVRGSLGTHEHGLIITTCDFSPGARKEASRLDATPVALMNGEQLVNVLVEHGIGVSRQSLDLIDISETSDLR